MADYLRLARESARKERSHSYSPVSKNSDRDESDRSSVDASPIALVMDTTECLATLYAPLGSARRALQEVLLSDSRLRSRFETSCLDSAAALRREVLAIRAALKQHGYAFRRHDREHEETAAAIYELAGEIMPGSPGAALARLRGRIKARDATRTAEQAVENLAAEEPEVYDDLVLLSGQPPRQERLQVVAQRIWIELRRRGHDHEPRGFSDHVCNALGEMFPGCPGTHWDTEWAAAIYSRVLSDYARRAKDAGLESAKIDGSRFAAEMNEMSTAEDAGDRITFRKAARRAAVEGRRAGTEALPGEHGRDIR